MYGLLLLMIVADTCLDFLLDEPWIRSQKCQLTGVEDLLFFFDFIVELHETFSVQSHKSHVLSRKTLGLLTDV